MSLSFELCLIIFKTLINYNWNSEYQTKDETLVSAAKNLTEASFNYFDEGSIQVLHHHVFVILFVVYFFSPEVQRLYGVANADIISSNKFILSEWSNITFRSQKYSFILVIHGFHRKKVNPARNIIYFFNFLIFKGKNS